MGVRESGQCGSHNPAKGKRQFSDLGNLLLEYIHLIQEQDNGGSDEPLRVNNTVEQNERLGEAVLKKGIIRSEWNDMTPTSDH